MARQWRLRVGRHTNEQFGLEKIIRQSVQQTMAASNNARGRPDYAERNAAKSTTPKPRPNEKNWIALFAAASFQITRKGEVTLQFSTPEDAPLWIDGKSMPFANRKKMELDAGRHDLVLQLNPRTLPEFIRAECAQAVFLVD